MANLHDVFHGNTPGKGRERAGENCLKFGVCLPGILILAVLVLSACGRGETALRKRVDATAARLDQALVQAKAEVVRLRDAAARLLADPEKLAAAGTPNPKTHRFFGSEGVYFKHVDDGGCALWASGHTPVGADVLRKIALLETLEPEIADMVKRKGLTAQAYLLSSDNFALFSPYLDSAAIFPPRVDFNEAYAPFYEAAPGHNPERKEVWLKPYLDATGKGFMTSVSSPVYARDVFQGVAGGDVVAADVKEAFLDPERAQAILTRELIPLAMTDKFAAALGLHDLSKFSYLKGVDKDVYAPEAYALSQRGGDAAILGERLAREKSFEWKTGGGTFDVYAATIPETGWLLIEMIEQ